MNINFLDNSPSWIARFHTDRMLARRIDDTARLLRMAHVHIDGEQTAFSRLGNSFKAEQHRAVGWVYVRWISETTGNYEWTARLFGQLCLEFALRHSAMHKMELLVALLKQRPLNTPFGELQPFPQQTLPRRYHRADPVEAHRLYYFNEMPRGFDVKWSSPARTPDWWRTLGATMPVASHG